METNTKERILEEALRLFSQNGYMATSMSDIAKQLHITKPALYKHYESKQEIFDGILQRMEQMDYERAKEYAMPEGTVEEMVEKYSAASFEKIRRYSEAQFCYWTEEEFPASFRKMLTLEQYRDEKMASLYQQYFVAGPIGYVTDLFQMILSQEEARQLALDFYAPMYMLYALYDGATDKKMVNADLKKCVNRFADRLEGKLK